MLQIVYIHIPKTAGSSVLSLFKDNFENDEIVQIKRKFFAKNPTIAPSRLLTDSIQPKTKVLHGHFTFNELNLVLKSYPDAKIISFLREPVQRVISNFNYFKKRIHTGKVSSSQVSRIDESLLTYARLAKSRNRMSFFLDGIRIENLFYLGLVENFDEDVKTMFSLLNLKVNRIPRINENELIRMPETSVTTREIEEIKNLNQKDILLYQQAKKIKEIDS